MTRERGVDLLVRLVTALFVASACGPAAPSPAASSPAASPAAAWAPQTAWERALVDVDANGERSKESALRLFATAYGALPGVDAQQDLAGIFSRTVAIRAIGRHMAELTEDQRKAVEAYLAVPDDAITVEIPPVARLGTMRLVQAGPSVEQALREVAEEVRIDIASKIGDYDGFLRVSLIPRPDSVQPIDGQYPNGGAQAQYLFGAYLGCQISIYSEAAEQSGLQLTALMTHEVFHCFQQAIHRTRDVHEGAPDWITEGQATWVGLELGGPSPNYQRFWDRYLLQPWLSLNSRAYDAVGFYAHIAETGTDPWTVLRPMLEAGTNSLAAYLAAGADRETFVDSWASGVIRQGAPGSAWNTTGPGITQSAYSPVRHDVGDGSEIQLSQPFFSNDVDLYNLNVDMVQIEIDGHARLMDGALDVPIHGTALYCVQGRDCTKVCPGQEPPSTQGTVGSQITLAESGGHEGLVGVLRGITLDTESCSPPPSAEPSDGEFCRRYRDYVAWAESLPDDSDVTRELAAEVATRFEGMWPVAPAELKKWVELMFTIYATFAGFEEPYNIPITGQVSGIANLPEALMTMHAYCGIPWPGG